MAQVWLLIFITMFVMVLMMSLFSRLYWTPVNNYVQDRQVNPRQHPKTLSLFDYGSYYAMYIMNILTNQVKYSFFFLFIYYYYFICLPKLVAKLANARSEYRSMSFIFKSYYCFGYRR